MKSALHQKRCFWLGSDLHCDGETIETIYQKWWEIGDVIIKLLNLVLATLVGLWREKNK